MRSALRGEQPFEQNDKTAEQPLRQEAKHAHQQRAFDRFRAEYNNHRPHEALGQTPPRAHYEPSLRRMPESLRPPDYGNDFVARSVSVNGLFSWRGTKLRVSKLLADQPVGLKQIDEDEWELFYGPVLLGYVLSRDSKIRLAPP